MNRAIYLHKDSRKRRGIKIPIGQYFKVLSRYLRGHVPGLVFLGFLMFGGVAVQLINPQIMRGFIDAARAEEEMALLLRRAVLFFGMIVLLQIIRAFSNYVGQVIGWTSTNDLRADVAEHCLRLVCWSMHRSSSWSTTSRARQVIRTHCYSLEKLNE